MNLALRSMRRPFRDGAFHRVNLQISRLRRALVKDPAHPRCSQQTDVEGLGCRLRTSGSALKCETRAFFAARSSLRAALLLVVTLAVCQRWRRYPGDGAEFLRFYREPRQF